MSCNDCSLETNNYIPHNRNARIKSLAEQIEGEEVIIGERGKSGVRVVEDADGHKHAQSEIRQATINLIDRGNSFEELSYQYKTQQLSPSND